VSPRDPKDRSEGWESFAQEAEGGTLAPSAELEAALREATEAVEARDKAREGRKEEAEQDSGALRAELERLTGELERARREAAESRDRWLRSQADFENLRRRNLRERQETLQYGHENLVKDLLGTVDNLERAIDHAKESETKDLGGLLQGVELALRELNTVLVKHGVARIEAEGETFDPNVHEAVAQSEEGSAPPGSVARVYQKGYRLRDRLLRPARVVVAVAPKPKPDEADTSKEN
jgi:molecular chaperone GrpE